MHAPFQTFQSSRPDAARPLKRRQFITLTTFVHAVKYDFQITKSELTAMQREKLIQKAATAKNSQFQLLRRSPINELLLQTTTQHTRVSARQQ